MLQACAHQRPHRHRETRSGRSYYASAAADFRQSSNERSHHRSAFTRTTPPPWSDGNTLFFHFREENIPGKLETWVYWTVVNIHADNLWEITKTLKTDSVEMLILPITNSQTSTQDSAAPPRPIRYKSAYALVIDPRIPKEWLRTKTPRRANPPNCSRLSRLLSQWQMIHNGIVPQKRPKDAELLKSPCKFSPRPATNQCSN